MRLLMLANNWLGWQAVRWLRTQGDTIVGLVLHPPRKRTYGDAILESAGVAPTAVFDGSRLRRPEIVSAIRGLRAEMALSVLFGYLVEPAFLALFPRGILNLHPGLLPYNRGQYPNVWSIVERTPAGVTLHHLDEGIDTGDIIAQQAVPVDPTDTGETLYRKLEQAALGLLQETWPLIRAGRAPRRPQGGPGTRHRRQDVAAIDRIELDQTYVARDLIDRLRARTFPPYPGLYVEVEGRRVYLRLQLLSEQEVQASAPSPRGLAGSRIAS